MISLLNLFSTSCPGGGFFILPPWYAYLPGTTDANGQCVPQFTSLSDVWLVVAAIIEMLLRVAAVVAVFMVLFGGVTYVTSQGNPEDTTKARQTIIYSLVGLLISISAAFIVTFVAHSLGA